MSTIERPKLAFRPKNPHTLESPKTGEIRYLANGTRVLVLAPHGWSYNGYAFLPFGASAAVAVDCGYVWDPRTFEGSELLTPYEYADHAANKAGYLRYMAGVREREAKSLDAQADLLLEVAARLSDV